MGKAEICLQQLTDRGNSIMMALLLILLVPGPCKVLLVAAAAGGPWGCSAAQEVMVSVLPISTQPSAAANPAPHSSPHSFIALPTSFCPWPVTQLQMFLSQLSLPKTSEKFWASTAFGLLFRTCLTNSKARNKHHGHNWGSNTKRSHPF